MIVCLCKGITQDDIIEALSTADDTVDIHDIIWLTNCTTDCGCCTDYIDRMIKTWSNEQKNKNRKNDKRG